MAFVRAARCEDVPAGSSHYVEPAGQPVLLVNVAGKLVALAGICPHRNLPLRGAHLWGDRIDCPWHHFQYCARTGENVYPKNVYPASMTRLRDQVQPLARFPLEVRNGEIWVDAESPSAALAEPHKQ